MKNLVNKVVTEKFEFMGETIEVKKLSVKEVFKMQDLVAKANKSKSENAQLSLLKSIIRLAVLDAEEITDDEFDNFPLGELSTLAEKIVEFAGLGGNANTGN